MEVDDAPIKPVSRLRGIGGLMAAAIVALGVGELVGGIVASWPSPVEAVANAAIDLSPPRMTRFGIDTFGSNDKLALVLGILVILVVTAIVVGAIAARKHRAGYIAILVLSAVGLAATSRYDGGVFQYVPGMAALAAGWATWAALTAGSNRAQQVDSSPTSQPTTTPDRADVQPDTPVQPGQNSESPIIHRPTGRANGRVAPIFVGRRGFTALVVGFVVVGGAAAAGGRRLAGRFSAAASRAGIRLPSVARPLAEAPAGIVATAQGTAIDSLSPFFTPNADFYRVDTALVVPQLRAEDWRLRIHGQVERPYQLNWDTFTDLDLIEADITMTCVSNPVGGELVGTARWLGVKLSDLLDRAGVKPGVDQIVGRSVDGYTCGFPLQAAYDRNAIVAIGMNGEPLPIEHGFPARLITPGLYGYVANTKWLTEIELTTFAEFDQYWVPRGYSALAPVKQMSRIDVPQSGTILKPGPVVVAGVAWAQTKGISKVEISFDGGPFTEVTLADELNSDTWRQWSHPWEATEGSHRIVIRSYDGSGYVQTEERAEIKPNGTSGWQSRLIVVSAQ